MSHTIQLDLDTFNCLNLAPVETVFETASQNGTWMDLADRIQFEIDYPRQPEDPRELSEIPEVRLWFLRLDARYPWTPFLLDWEAGELARYTAMLVPHQFSRTEGIQFNPEALELFVMGKIFAISDWLRRENLAGQSRLQFMAQMLGYELEDALFELLSA